MISVLIKVIKATETGSTDLALPLFLGVVNRGGLTVTVLVSISKETFSTAKFTEEKLPLRFGLRLFSSRSVHPHN